LLEKIIEIHEESNERYGSPRIHAELTASDVHCNVKTVEKLMKQNEIAAKRKRKFKATTDSKHDLPIAPNVLGREFAVEHEDEVWVSDITYIATAQSWLYLAVFIDLRTRKIVGWSMSDEMTAELVVNAFKMGVQRQGQAPLVAHSDRGSQYASSLFRNTLELHSVIQSMSRKGNCWDNAPAESFFGSLKTELIYRQIYKTQEAAQFDIFEYIEIFYNKRRRHSSLGYKTPEEFSLKNRKVA